MKSVIPAKFAKANASLPAGRQGGIHHCFFSMSPKSLFLILISFAALTEAIGDIILKQWTINGKNLTFILGFIVYICSTFIWALSLRHEYLSKAISVITVLNLIIVVLVGILYFKEDLTMINKVGIVLGVISVILIEA